MRHLPSSILLLTAAAATPAPAAAQAPAQARNPEHSELCILVTDRGPLLCGDRWIEREQLAAHVRDLLAKGDRTIVVVVDPTSAAKTLVNVVDLVHAAGARSVSIAALPKAVKPDVPARAVRRVMPRRTRKGKARTAVKVTVDLLVSSQGRVIDAGVVKSTSPGYERAVLDAVVKWRFEPGKLDGKPCVTSLRLPVVFAGG